MNTLTFLAIYGLCFVVFAILANWYKWARYIFFLLVAVALGFTIYGTCYAIYNVIHK